MGEREGGRGDDTSILLAGSICVSFYIHTVCPRMDHFMHQSFLQSKSSLLDQQFY